MSRYFWVKKQFISLLIFVVSFVLVFAPNAYAVEVVISGNGEGSVNEVVVQQTQEVVVEQSNEASVVNEIDTQASTGDNSVSNTTGGEVVIATGDVAAEIVVENAVNESSVEVECCSAGVDVTVSDNGADSKNTVDLETGGNTTVVVRQVADIVNEVNGSANTGNNSVSGSSGDVKIDTGDIYVGGGISNGPINIANVSGSSGRGRVSFNVSGNGPDSVNNIFLALNSDSNIRIQHFTDVRNSVNWDLNTGGNEVNGTTGNVNIKTGDIFLDFFIKNGPINVSGVDWDCCDQDDDPAEPDDPGGPGDPGGGEIGGVDGIDDGGGESSSSSSSSSSGGSDVGGISILGLSDTTSAQAQSLIFFAGLLMMFFGIRLFGEELLGIIHCINAK